MSDNIPFDIQQEIIKKVSNVKSLVQFRSVSKRWKSFIDSSEFIAGYGARHTHPHSFILRYKFDKICLVDDDNETFEVQPEFAPFVLSPLLKLIVSYVVGTCHGLLCLFGLHKGYGKWMIVIWNPSIRKSFGIALPHYYQMNRQTLTYPLFKQLMFGFGVCPVTKDPTVVKIVSPCNKPRYVEVFTLSSGVWNVIPRGNLPRQSIQLNPTAHVLIDRFIYWGAYEKTFIDNGESTTNGMVVSFDLITKEFKVVDLPDSLTKELCSHCSVSKLNESLVVYGSIKYGSRIVPWSRGQGNMSMGKGENAKLVNDDEDDEDDDRDVDGDDGDPSFILTSSDKNQKTENDIEMLTELLCVEYQLTSAIRLRIFFRK
ncbi:probable galacturonosyltransferase 7 isoform X2 [Tanacetum coccineum]